MNYPPGITSQMANRLHQAQGEEMYLMAPKVQPEPLHAWYLVAVYRSAVASCGRTRAIDTDRRFISLRPAAYNNNNVRSLLIPVNFLSKSRYADCHEKNSPCAMVIIRLHAACWMLKLS